MEVFDHSKLKGLCREKGETVESLAKRLGITTTTMSKKWNGKSNFNDAEIFTLKVLLGIENVEPYFFTPKA